MSERLDLIKSLIVPSRVVADVGCDHGLIAEYCAKSGIAESVIASDISEKCLQKAKTLLSGMPNVRFVCCDGLGYDCDQAVIAGMGGMLVCDILRSAHSLPKTLIASPHRDSGSVRSTLIELGYGIDRDIPIFDRNKFYYVIRADKTCGERQLTELQITFGKDCTVPNAALSKRLRQLYTIYSVAPEQNSARLKVITEAMKLQNIQP